MLKKLTLIVLIAFALSSLAFQLTVSQDKKAGFIGAEKCGVCHKKDKDGNQLKVWQESAHAKAFATLKTDAAKKLAANAAENETCLKCHATGYGSDAAMNDKKFSMEDGVQCEACHGAGSEYKSMKIMKDEKEAIKNGLIVYANEQEIEKLCQTCHNQANKPADHPKADFKFKEMYAKIAHPYPAK